MKELGFTFGIPDSRWSAVLPYSEEQKYQLVLQLRSSPRQFVKLSGVPEFILLGYRNFETETGKQAWNAKTTFSGEIVVDSSGSSDFKHLLMWKSYPGFVIPLAGTPDSSLPYCMLISDTIKTLLQKFKLLDTQFIPVLVKHELTGEKRKYYFLNGTTQNWNSLDNKLHWLSMEWTYINKETKEVIAELKKGKIDCAETFWKEQEKVRPKNVMDIMKFDSIIPEYIFIEEYDGLQMLMKYIFTEEVAHLIRQKAGLDSVISYQMLNVLTGQYKHEY